MRNESPLLSWKASLGGIVACALAFGSARAQDLRTIEGQVFIRTKGADTLKLSLVDVLLFDEKLLSANLDKKRSKAQPFEEYIGPLEKTAHEAFVKAKKVVEAANRIWDEDMGRKEGAWNKLRDRLLFLHSSYFFFAGLPEPLQTTKTDADGKFNFKIPRGSYALVAQSSRQAGGKTEVYHWMVKVTVDADKKVMLANDNLTDSGSADSMIAAPGDEYRIPYSDELLSIDTMSAFVEKDRRERIASVAAEAAKQEAARDAAREDELAEAAKNEIDRQSQLKVFRKDPKSAQLKAVKLYPELGVAGSPLNKEFVERLKRYQTEKKEFFAEPDWPVRLAKECSEALAIKSVPK